MGKNQIAKARMGKVQSRPSFAGIAKGEPHGRVYGVSAWIMPIPQLPHSLHQSLLLNAPPKP